MKTKLKIFASSLNYVTVATLFNVFMINREHDKYHYIDPSFSTVNKFNRPKRLAHHLFPSIVKESQTLYNRLMNNYPPYNEMLSIVKFIYVCNKFINLLFNNGNIVQCWKLKRDNYSKPLIERTHIGDQSIIYQFIVCHSYINETKWDYQIVNLRLPHNITRDEIFSLEVT